MGTIFGMKTATKVGTGENTSHHAEKEGFQEAARMAGASFSTRRDYTEARCGPEFQDAGVRINFMQRSEVRSMPGTITFEPLGIGDLIRRSRHVVPPISVHMHGRSATFEIYSKTLMAR